MMALYSLTPLLPYSATPLLGARELASLLLMLGCFFGFCALVTLVLWAVLANHEVHFASHSSGDSLPLDKRGEMFFEPRSKKLEGIRMTGPEFYPGFVYVERKAARFLFDPEIRRGEARYDDRYSVVYNIRPSETDDLTLIKGIDHAAQEWLNSLGCFTFKQVAAWSIETCRKIAGELGCQDRLFQENWPEQARALHLEKFGHPIF